MEPSRWTQQIIGMADFETTEHLGLFVMQLNYGIIHFIQKILIAYFVHLVYFLTWLSVLFLEYQVTQVK